MGGDAEAVYKSVENLFSGHADKLVFPPLHVVYTIPPYLPILAAGIGAFLGGDAGTASWPAWESVWASATCPVPCSISTGRGRDGGDSRGRVSFDVARLVELRVRAPRSRNRKREGLTDEPESDNRIRSSSWVHPEQYQEDLQ